MKVCNSCKQVLLLLFSALDSSDTNDSVDGGIDGDDLRVEGSIAEHGPDDALARAQHHAHRPVEAVHPPRHRLLERWAHWKQNYGKVRKKVRLYLLIDNNNKKYRKLADPARFASPKKNPVEIPG